MAIPLRKRRQLRYDTKYGYVVIDILQATLRESLRFSELINQDRLSDWRLEFLDNNVKIYPKGIYKYLWWYKKKIMDIVMSGNIGLINEVKSLRDKDYESIYIGVEFDSEGRKALPDSEIIDAVSSFNMSFLDLLDKCTREQYLRMVDQCTYKSFEQNEKHQKYNNQAISKVRSIMTDDMVETRDIIKRQRAEGGFKDVKNAKFIIETE